MTFCLDEVEAQAYVSLLQKCREVSVILHVSSVGTVSGLTSLGLGQSSRSQSQVSSHDCLPCR